MSLTYTEKKERWHRFGIKACGFLTLMGLIALFFTRFSIGYDPQDVRCFPDYSVFLIDKKDQAMVRDGLYAFHGKGMEPLLKDGTRMLKQLKGMPGDLVEIDVLENILVNGEVVANGLPMAEKLGKPTALFKGKGELKNGTYWFMGEINESFDSRYWGTVADEQIIGRAYPLF